MTEKYDIAILGSGLGGLLCGALMSRKGKRVLILEQNEHIGGSLQSFSINGCTFSTGLHYMGSLDKNQNLHKIFSYFNLLDDIEYLRLDENGFDIFNIGGKEYKFPIGWERFQKTLSEYFPDDKTSIELYTSGIQKVVESQDIYLLKQPSGDKNINPALTTNTWDFICSVTKNNKLRQVLSALNFVYAGEKDKSPLYVHALINNHYISSSYRIVGPTSQIANRLESQILENNGYIQCNSRVTGLKVDNDTVRSILTDNGEKYLADVVISNIHPAVTMDLIPNGDIKKSFRSRLKRKENTLSAFAVHLVLKKNSFKYRNYNYNYYCNDVWYASNYKPENWPEHFMLHCKPPLDKSEYTNCAGLLTHMSFEEVSEWKHLPHSERGDKYRKFKDTKAKQLIELAFQKFPELEGNIESFNVSTPLTYRDYLGSPEGSMYGTIRDYRNPIGSYISPLTKIKNLYFTGQNLNLHGILGVSLSALITCGEFLGLDNILNEINIEYQKK